MDQRAYGTTGITVSAFGLGTGQVGRDSLASVTDGDERAAGTDQPVASRYARVATRPFATTSIISSRIRSSEYA